MRLLIKAISSAFLGILLLGCEADVSRDKEADEEPSMFMKRKMENYVIFSPMEGVLKENGKPLANTKIIRRLRWNSNDEGLVEEFITDDQGRFSLPIHEESLALGMLNQFVSSAKLEVQIKNNIIDVWYNSKLLPELHAETGGSISELICDLNNEEIPVYINESIIADIMTRCRWKNMPKS